MPALLTQIVYLKYRAGAPAVPSTFLPTYRSDGNADTLHRGRGNSQTLHRSRVDTTTVWRSRGDIR